LKEAVFKVGFAVGMAGDIIGEMRLEDLAGPGSIARGTINQAKIVWPSQVL